MKKATALLIRNRYPENISVTGTEDAITNKWKVGVFLMEKKQIVKLLLESPCVFQSRYESEEHGKAVCESIVNDQTLMDKILKTN